MEYLTLCGHFVWRNNTGVASYGDRRVFFGKVGSADILGVHKGTGKIIAIEVKRPDGKRKATPAQELFLQEIRDRGGYAGIAMSIEDVDKVLMGDSTVGNRL